MRITPWVLVLAVMALVLWIRILPLSLPATEIEAENLVRARLRSNFEHEVPSTLPPARRSAEVDERLRTWITQHRDRFVAGKAALATRLRADLTYEGPGGNAFPYLGDLDSYNWLREARNYLRSGTTCDVVSDGECRDTDVMAPVGARMFYPRSLHIAAIVAVHKLIGIAFPDHPLPASAMLVPVIAGTLGVVPAFWIGWRFGGPLAGVTAAVLSALHPQLLLRSTGGDNDVWNVVLPLFMMWAAIAALHATQPARRTAYTIIAAAVAVLHAATWSGWQFSYGVLLCGLFGAALLQGVHFVLRTRSLRVWQAPDVRAALSVCLVFYLAVELATPLAAAERSSLTASLAGLLRTAPASPTVTEARPLSERDLWPDMLEMVNEARRPAFATLLRSVGGLFLLLCGFGGLCILVFDLCRRAPSARGNAGPALITVVWLVAASYTAAGAMRFLFFLGPPFAIAVAVAVGRVHASVSCAERHAPHRWWTVARGVSWTFAAIVLLTATQRGYATAEGYLPLINDAWWDTLTNIRDHAAPGAIVNVAWEYGYWTKYVAERRVSADGASLRTHVPYWLDHALATPSERESTGVLHMLACGSDATPLPEARQGAYAKARARGYDALAAPQIVLSLVRLSAAQADAYLVERGLAAADREDMLRSTHCVPPETYLVTSSAQSRTAEAWLRAGLWDFSRAYIRQQALRLPKDAAVSDLASRFGYGVSEAAALLSEAGRLKADFIVPPAAYVAPYVSAQWLPCSPATDGAVLHCPVDLVHERSGMVLQEFVYDPASPQNSRLRLATVDANDLTGPAEGVPTALVVADARGLTDVDLPASAHPALGVLIDTLRQRILLGAPAFLHSTFVQLQYLDGRYSSQYEKVGERQALSGERVVTWRVHWEPRIAAESDHAG